MSDILLGGYRAFTTAELWNLCVLSTEKKLSLAGLRIYIAAAEMKERRVGTKKTPFYGVGELQKLSGLGDRSTRDGLRELKKLGILDFTEENVAFSQQATIDFEEQPFGTDPNRLVPVPRRLLRELSSHTKKREIIVALIHCARGLFLIGKKLVMRGVVSSSWISATFSIGKSTIHKTRAWLRSLSFMKEQEEVEQWRKNRFGFYFQILSGKLPKSPKRNSRKNALIGGLYKRTPFNKLKLNNQYSTLSTSRIKTTKEYPFSGFPKGKDSTPTIKDIKLDDLKRLSRLLVLYNQAVKARWIEDSEYNLRNFVAAAVRATKVSGNPVKIFVGIVKKGLWNYITIEQEERAADVLKKHSLKVANNNIEKVKNLTIHLLQNVSTVP